MTEVTGSVKQVGQGLTQKTFKYDALGSLVDIIFNAAGTLKYTTDSATNFLHPPQVRLSRLLYRSRHQVEVEEAAVLAVYVLRRHQDQSHYPADQLPQV